MDIDLNSFYTWGWIIWLLAFVGLEGAAIKNKNPGDTLSEHVWKIFKIDPDTPWVFPPRKLLLVALMGGGLLHFFTGY